VAVEAGERAMVTPSETLANEADDAKLAARGRHGVFDFGRVSAPLLLAPSSGLGAVWAGLSSGSTSTQSDL